MIDTKCGIYKYVCNDQIIYIGKSDKSLARRIFAHQTEEKFLPYIDQADIYYFPCSTAAETIIYETYLINKYKPILNDSMKYYQEQSFEIKEKEWIPYCTKNVWDFTKMNPKERQERLMILYQYLYRPFNSSLNIDKNRYIITSDIELPYICIFDNNQSFRLMLFELNSSSKTLTYYTTYNLLKKFIDFYQMKLLSYTDEIYEELHKQYEILIKTQESIKYLEKELHSKIFQI